MKVIKPEIQSMMTLSTAHVSAGTIGILENQDQPENNLGGVAVYPVTAGDETYGWLLMFSQGVMDELPDDAPQDVRNVIRYALSMNCTVVYLDGDGPVIQSLPDYDHESEG